MWVNYSRLEKHDCKLKQLSLPFRTSRALHLFFLPRSTKHSFSLKHLRYFKETIEAVRLAHAMGAEVLILSDANTWYINSILKSLNIDHLFTEVISNRVIWKALTCRIRPYHEEPHACDQCPQNLCKGYVMKNILSHRTSGGITERPKVVYLGDGGGDFCPCSQLESGDVICARKEWRLHQKLAKLSESTLKARLETWDNGSDVLRIFKNIFWNQNDQRGCSY